MPSMKFFRLFIASSRSINAELELSTFPYCLYCGIESKHLLAFYCIIRGRRPHTAQNITLHCRRVEGAQGQEERATSESVSQHILLYIHTVYI